MSRYPTQPGYKEVGATSQAAAQTIASKTENVRELVWRTISVHGAMTADEVAARLGISILTVRPRCSELVKMGQLIKTGIRRENQSGMKAHVLDIPTRESEQMEFFE